MTDPRAAAWDLYAAGYLAAGWTLSHSTQSVEAARNADELLAERDKRFHAAQPLGHDYGANPPALERDGGREGGQLRDGLGRRILSTEEVEHLDAVQREAYARGVRDERQRVVAYLERYADEIEFCPGGLPDTAARIRGIAGTLESSPADESGT